MNIKFRIIIFLAAALLSVQAAAQVNIGYTYDVAGNRIAKYVTTPMAAPEQVEPAFPEYVQAENEKTVNGETENGERINAQTDNVGTEISVYPNPTIDGVTVRTSATDETTTTEIALYNTNGNRLVSRKSKTELTQIDMSKLPAGAYIMKISGNGKTVEWKIIKE